MAGFETAASPLSPRAARIPASGGGATALALLLLLAGCGALGPGEGGGAADRGGPARTTELVETDVEAPESFQVTEPGLWDGRPSLGGVWVAHPEVDEPERVIIRNQDNGQFVIGALFRRERENPGPALQVSSDAAEALGMLAGAPATLNVTALRREEAAEPEPTEASAPVAIPDPAAPEAEGVAALAPEAVTTTALDGAAPAEAAPPEASAPLPPADPAAAEAVARATAAILAGTPGAAAPAAPEAAPAEPAPAAASALERPFIQLGIFSVEANAAELAAQMTAQGLPAQVVAATTQGRAFWRVLVGPAPDAATREAYLGRVQAAGFADAYAVRN